MCDIIQVKSSFFDLIGEKIRSLQERVISPKSNLPCMCSKAKPIQALAKARSPRFNPGQNFSIPDLDRNCLQRSSSDKNIAVKGFTHSKYCLDKEG